MWMKLGLLSAVLVVALAGCSSEEGGPVEVTDNEGNPGEDGENTPENTPENTTGSASGIGTACDVDADCESGQFCNLDSTSYLFHRQCSDSCASSEACAESYGEKSHCTGGNLCVASCTTDAECPEQTVCGDFGACERSGPASGNPYCSGSPTPCSLLSDSDCYSQLGCSPDGTCSGVADSCYLKSTSYSCERLEGCRWSSASDSCSGVADSCSSIDRSFDCQTQDGCSWNEKCGGSPLDAACADIFLFRCEDTPGCTLVMP